MVHAPLCGFPAADFVFVHFWLLQQETKAYFLFIFACISVECLGIPSASYLQDYNIHSLQNFFKLDPLSVLL